MRVLIDTNVILDLFLSRPSFVEDAEALWEANNHGDIQAFVSGITPISLFYFASKVKGREVARQVVVDLLTSIRVCEANQTVFQSALFLPISDYEDAVQVASAINAQLDAIITRDLKDFKNSPLPVYSPADFLQNLKLNQQA